MPELPEVETTLRAIEKFQSLKIHEVKIYNRNLRWKISKDFESLTIGQTVEVIKRRAKYLIFHLSNGQNIILHLGMSGSLRIAKNNENFLSFTEKHRLKSLPDLIARLEAEIVKLETYLSEPDLYSAAPLKFEKATQALLERQNALSEAEEDWLMLEERSQG